MKLHGTVLTLAAAVALALSASAQQPNTNNQQQGQGMQGMQQGKHKQMDQMEQHCRKNMNEMRQSNDRTRQTIEAAKKSNNPAEMRAALDQAEKALSSMDDHMKTCMNRMNMMQNMQGMGGMMSPQQNGKQQSPQPQQ